MKRKTVHGGFAAATLCFAVVTTGYWLEVDAGRSVIRALEQVALVWTVEELASNKRSFHYPATRLARANALSAGGDFEQAEAAFNELIREFKFAPVGQAAQFNLANAYLRQGMRRDIKESHKKPMLELAKQRYRNLLRVVPDNWDARYNLERALRLAPEDANALADDKGDPIKRVNVIVPAFEVKDLP